MLLFRCGFRSKEPLGIHVLSVSMQIDILYYFLRQFTAFFGHNTQILRSLQVGGFLFQCKIDEKLFAAICATKHMQGGRSPAP